MKPSMGMRKGERNYEEYWSDEKEVWGRVKSLRSRAEEWKRWKKLLKSKEVRKRKCEGELKVYETEQRNGNGERNYWRVREWERWRNAEEQGSEDGVWRRVREGEKGMREEKMVWN
jgi:hypothetical protein